MKIRILVVGKSDDAEYARGVERYLARIQRFVPAELAVVKEERPGEKAAPDRIRAEEGRRIQACLDPRDLVVLCDESGEQPSSAELARKLRAWLDASPRSVTFVVGGAFGLEPSLRTRSRAILSLSRLTLPHQLARVVLVEQVYRAVATLHGVAYSK